MRRPKPIPALALAAIEDARLGSGKYDAAWFLSVKFRPLLNALAWERRDVACADWFKRHPEVKP